jgi:hypothetical protein
LNVHLVPDDASEKELRSLPVVHDDDDCNGAEPCSPVVRIPFSRVLGLDPHGCRREDLAELWFRILPKSPLACCSGEKKAKGGGGTKKQPRFIICVDLAHIVGDTMKLIGNRGWDVFLQLMPTEQY